MKKLNNIKKKFLKLKLKNFTKKLPQNKSIIIREIILKFLFSQYIKRNFQFLKKINKNFGDDIKSIINLFNKLNINNPTKINLFLLIKLLISKSIKINIKESGFVARFSFIFIPFYLHYLNGLKLKRIIIYGEKTIKYRKLFVKDELFNTLQNLFPNVKIEFLRNSDFLPVSFSLIKKENEPHNIEKDNNNNSFIEKNLIINFNLKKTSQNLSSLLLILPFIILHNNNKKIKNKNLEFIEVEINNIKSYSYILITLYLLIKNKINIFYKENNQYLLVDKNILNKIYKELIINNFELNAGNNIINNFNLKLKFIKPNISENNNFNIFNDFNNFNNENLNYFNFIQKIDLSILPYFFILFLINNENTILNNIFDKYFFEILNDPEKNNYFYYQGDYLFFILYEKLNQNNKEFFYFNFENSPDIIFPSIILTIIKKKKVYFYGIERLKYKESNRIFSIVKEFNKLNVNLIYDQNKEFLFLDGNEAYDRILEKKKEFLNKNILKNILINSHGDHRLVYTFSILGEIYNLKIKIINKKCVSKTFPKFFKILRLVKNFNKKENIELKKIEK